MRVNWDQSSICHCGNNLPLVQNGKGKQIMGERESYLVQNFISIAKFKVLRRNYTLRLLETLIDDVHIAPMPQ